MCSYSYLVKGEVLCFLYSTCLVKSEMFLSSAVSKASIIKAIT
jgi:hypothetical protein